MGGITFEKQIDLASDLVLGQIVLGQGGRALGRRERVAQAGTRQRLSKVPSAEGASEVGERLDGRLGGAGKGFTGCTTHRSGGLQGVGSDLESNGPSQLPRDETGEVDRLAVARTGQAAATSTGRDRPP